MLAPAPPGPVPASASAAAAPAAPPTEVSGVTVVVRRPTKVSGVTVQARLCPEPSPQRYAVYTDPRVIDSFPAQGAVLAAGPVTVRITFDQPMSCYAELTIVGADEDPCDAAGTWSLPGRRTWTTRCRFVSGAHYLMRFARSDGPGFVGLSGRQAVPFLLRFQTAEDGAPAAAPAVDPGPPAGPSVACTDAPAPHGGKECVRTPPPSPAPP